MTGLHAAFDPPMTSSSHPTSAPASRFNAYVIRHQPVRFNHVCAVIMCVQCKLCKKLSHRRGTARHAISVEILSAVVQLYETPYEKVCNE